MAACSRTPWPQAILFDFDGVIVDSEPIHFAAFQSVAAEENIELTEEAYYRDLIGFDDRGAFTFLFQRHARPLDPAELRRLMDRKARVVRQMLDRGDYKALPGVDEFVRAMATRCPLAICSGALRHEIEAMLIGIKLRECFHLIVAAEDVAIGKPDPQGYQLTVARLSESIGHTLSPADCLIIEDAPNVIRSVRAAGFPVLAVATSYPMDQLQHATYTVGSLEPAEIHRVLPDLAEHT